MLCLIFIYIVIASHAGTD